MVPVIQVDGKAPEILGELNGQAVLFLEDDNSTRVFLSDGTQEGTSLIADVAATVRREVKAAVLGSELYFSAAGVDGAELWKTDGTEAGTIQVVDLNSSAAAADPDSLTVFNGNL
ncbi:MAG: hypothetical protein R3C49_25665 [Planctomycetaceae bacterium]